jgi:hypothetical protein
MKKRLMFLALAMMLAVAPALTYSHEAQATMHIPMRR